MVATSKKYLGGFKLYENEIKQTANSSYRCEYHILFAPKYRRKFIYKTLRKDICQIFRKLCNELKLKIIEVYYDYIHMLVSVLPYMSVE